MSIFSLLPNGKFWSDLASWVAGPATYSNASGDFTAVVVDATKTITFSAIDANLLAALTSKSFTGATILRRNTSTGAVDTLPTTTVSWANPVLTLGDLSGNFAIATDEVLISVPGPIKAFRTVYNASPALRAEGISGNLQGDAVGNLLTTLGARIFGEDASNDLLGVMPKPVIDTKYSWTWFQNLGANATLNVKASQGQVGVFIMENLSGSKRYMQLHNTATVPAGGAVPVLTFPVPTGGVVALGLNELGMNGKNFPLGIAFACSTTGATYTAATATDHNTHIGYT